jgi:hypothetical protein
VFAVNQFATPVAFVHGEPAERTLTLEESYAWAAERMARCGHRDGAPSCRMCQGTLAAFDALSLGSPVVRLYPKS